MKKGLIFTLFLSVMLTGAMVFSVYLMEQKADREELYKEQTQILQQQEAQLAEKEAQFLELVQQYENGRTEGVVQLEQLRQDLKDLEAEREELRNLLVQATADVQALRQQLETDEESDQSYYLEVYNALKEGLEKVKGYITGN